MSRCCGYCRMPGHTIAQCNDNTISALKRDLQNAADFCIAYGSARYLKAWLSLCSVPKLRVILGYVPTLSNPNITLKHQYCITIKHTYYNDRLTEPNIKERLRAELPAILVANIRYTIIRWVQQGIIQPSQPRALQQADQDRLEQIEIEINRLNNEYERLNDDREAIIYRMSVRQAQIDETRQPRGKINMEIELQKQQNTEQVDCPICFDSIESNDICITNCGHGFCGECLSNYFKTMQSNHVPNHVPNCALCRTSVTKLQFKNETIMNELVDKYIKPIITEKPQEEEVDVTWTIERTINRLFNAV